MHPPYRTDSGYRALLHTVFGVLLAAAQAWVILAALGALPHEVIDIANQPTAAKGMFPQAMEVWSRFSNYGHRLITENLMTVLCLGPAIAINLFYGLQHLIESLAYSEQSESCAVLARLLRICKTAGAPLSALLTLAAYLAIAGVFPPSTL